MVMSIQTISTSAKPIKWSLKNKIDQQKLKNNCAKNEYIAFAL